MIRKGSRSFELNVLISVPDELIVNDNNKVCTCVPISISKKQTKRKRLMGKETDREVETET